MHRALAIAFHEANLRIDPFAVLTVEESVGNQVLYRWKAAVEVVHLDLAAAVVPDLGGSRIIARDVADHLRRQICER